MVPPLHVVLTLRALSACHLVPPGGKKTVSVTPLCAACNSMLMWSLPHCSLVFEWQLQSDPAAICAGETGANTKAAHDASPYFNPIVRSQRWEIQLPRLLVPPCEALKRCRRRLVKSPLWRRLAHGHHANSAPRSGSVRTQHPCRVFQIPYERETDVRHPVHRCFCCTN